MRHCRRCRPGLRLFARESASPPAARLLSPFLRPPSGVLAPFWVSKWLSVSGRDSEGPRRNPQEKRARAVAAGCEAGGLGEDGVWSWFHSLRKGTRLSGPARGEEQLPETFDLGFLCFEIISGNIFYPRGNF